MARPKKSTQETEPRTPSLADALREDAQLGSYSIGITPIIHIPIDSIGYQVMIQNTGFPVNCISMVIADAHAGKTTHSHVLANWFLRAGGDVILVEGDGILDEPYISRFYDFNPANEHERVEQPLAYYIQLLANRLDKRKNIPLLTRKALEAQHTAAALLQKETFNPANRLHREILYLAQSAWRTRQILRIDAESSEELEELITKIYNQKLITDPKISRPTLVIIDPVTNFIPEELLKLGDSAGGRKMAMAAYLHQFFRKWSKKLANAHIHLHLTAKQAAYIPKPYEFPSEFD